MILAEVVGTVALGIILGSLSSMFTSSRLLDDRVDKQLAELREYLNEKHVPPKLRSRVRHYMELLYRRRTGYDEKQLLAQLPAPLAREMVDLLYRCVSKTLGKSSKHLCSPCKACLAASRLVVCSKKLEAVPGLRGLPDEVFNVDFGADDVFNVDFGADDAVLVLILVLMMLY